MDAAHARLIELLQSLALQLASGHSLAQCLRRLPRSEWRQLSAPLAPPPHLHWPCRRAASAEQEAWLLARLALAAGRDEPERLPAALTELARDLAARR